MAKPSVASFASAASMSASGSPIDSASALAATGPSPSSRLRTISTSASSAGHERAANSAGAAIGGDTVGVRKHGGELRQTLGGNPERRFACGRCDRPGGSHGEPVARFASASAVRSDCHCSRRATSSSVTKASPSNASCNSSELTASGHASARTRSIASGSSRPTPAAVSFVQPTGGSSPRGYDAPRAARRRGTRTAARLRISSASGEVRSGRGARCESADSIPRSSLSSPRCPSPRRGNRERSD